MPILRLRDRYTGPVAQAATGLFLITALMYFLPIEIQSKIAIPVGIAALASLWVCPWEITMALLFSALGDLAGSCDRWVVIRLRPTLRGGTWHLRDPQREAHPQLV